MALIDRIARLFRADLHAVLDRIEEPEALLRQAVRDMQDELADGERRLARRTEAHKSLLLQRDDFRETLAGIESKLDLCFESKKDDLARGLIRRKLEIARLDKQLAARQVASTEAIEQQTAALAERRSTLDSLRQKAELFSQRAATEPAVAREAAVGDDEVEIAFLHEQSRRAAS